MEEERNNLQGQQNGISQSIWTKQWEDPHAKKGTKMGKDAA